MFNPIVSKNEIPKFNVFSKPPRGEPGVAIVLYKDHGASTALSPGQPLSMADLAWGKYAGYYRVDVGMHEFEFRVNIPSKENGLNFDAKVDIVYFVSEPSVVVDKQIRDPESLLKAHATETMRSISRRHEIDRSEDAEQEINNSFRRGYNLNGVSISKINVELSPDADANTHIRGKGLDRLQFEREKSRVGLYKSLIQQGEWELLAFKLAKNPDDVDQVIESMNTQRRRDLENYLFTIKQLEDNDIVEGFQVSDEVKRLLTKLADQLGIANGKKLLSSEESPKQLPTEKGKKRKES